MVRHEKYLSKEQFFASFSGKRIPVLAEGTVDLLQSLTDEEISYSKLVSLLEKFPSIAARLIALSNSSWSSPVQPIIALDRACSRLGLNVVKSVSIALTVSSSFNVSRCSTFSFEYYWSRAFLVAEIASLIAPLVDEQFQDSQFQVDSQSARSCGLLHSLGLLLLVHFFAEQSDQVLRSWSSHEQRKLNEIFSDEIGIGLMEAGELIATKWNLPSVIVAVMGNYERADYKSDDWPLVAIVAIAVEVATVLERNPDADLEKSTRLTELLSAEQIPQFTEDVIRTRRDIGELVKSISW